MNHFRHYLFRQLKGEGMKIYMKGKICFGQSIVSSDVGSIILERAVIEKNAVIAVVALPLRMCRME